MVQTPRKLLVADSDPTFRRVVMHAFRQDFELREAEGSEDALRIAAGWQPSVVLLDAALPAVGGHETCRRLSDLAEGFPPPRLIFTAKFSAEEQVRAFEAGACDCIAKPADIVEVRSRIHLHLRQCEIDGAAEIQRQIKEGHRAQMRQLAAQQAQEVIATQDIAVFALAGIAESRDQETGDHLERMRAYSQLLAEELQLRGPYTDEIDQQFLSDLYRSSPLHDIGKVGIPDAILQKPDALTDEEMQVMRRHAVIGANILDKAVMQSQFGSFLAMGAAIARFHHERWDGKGYPAGLIGKEIPLPARIVTVADVFDALTSKRPYKEAFSPFEAKQMIEEGDGTQFDPAVVDAFRAQFDEFLSVHEKSHRADGVVVGALAFAEFAY